MANDPSTSRSIYVNVLVVLVFAVLMAVAIVSVYKGEGNVERVAMETLADRFVNNVNAAHWQWRREGEPQRILFVHYGAVADAKGMPVESDRTPILMSHLGWPRVEPSAKGCQALWQNILNLPMTINGFKVTARFYDGVAMNKQALDSYCLFRVSTGPAFMYRIYTGQVQRVKQNILTLQH